VLARVCSLTDRISLLKRRGQILQMFYKAVTHLSTPRYVAGLVLLLLVTANIFKAFETYCKAAAADTTITFARIETALRDMNAPVYLVALERVGSETRTIVDLHGTIDQKYIVSLQLSPKPDRKKYEASWPKSTEENLERLGNAGFAMDNFKPKCSNCGGM